MLRTMEAIAKLPDEKLQEIADFSEFLLSKAEDQILVKGIQQMVTDSRSFQFLEDEEDLYAEDDLKEVFKL